MKNEELKVRLSNRDKNELKRQAAEHDMNMSEYVVYLIRKGEKKMSKYMVARLDFLSNEEKEKLFDDIKHYEYDDFDLFRAEYGWENWMYKFTEVDESEDIPDSDMKVIDEVLKKAWKEVMSHHYSVEFVTDEKIDEYAEYFPTIEDVKEFCKDKFYLLEDGREFYVVDMFTGEAMLELTNEVNEYYKIDVWETITSYMNDEIRESVHNELAECTRKEFFGRYMELDPEFQNILDSEFGSYDIDKILD